MISSTNGRRGSWRTLALVLTIAATLGGCATANSNPKDPFEKFNRSMFAFNDTIDKAALKPVATAYKKVLPTFVQTGVSNFFGNLADIWTGVNNLLQGKGKDGASDLGRFALNSTVGILGLFDVASEAGMRKHNEDFGQTLGVWGVPSGPYLMLPLLGPSTVRDTAALPLDIKADPWAYKKPVDWRNVGIVLRVVDQRASLLDASNLMEEAALDRYEFIRDGWLQRRESRIHDGDGPSKGSSNGGDEKPMSGKSIKDSYADDPALPLPAAAPAPAAPAAAAAPAAPAADAAPAATPATPAAPVSSEMPAK